MKKSFFQANFFIFFRGGKMTFLTYCSIARLIFVLSSYGSYQTKVDFLLISLGEKNSEKYSLLEQLFSSEVWPKKKGDSFFLENRLFLRNYPLLCEKIIISSDFFFLESKNSGSYGDFDIFCRIMGHREVKKFCKTLFETEV